VLHPLLTDYDALFRTEFFNRSVGPVYTLGPPFWFNDVHVRITAQGDVEVPRGRRVSSAYTVADPGLLLVGPRLARQQPGGLTLYGTNGPLRVAGRVSGLQQPLFVGHQSYPQLGWSGASFRVVRYGCAGGSATLTVEANPFLGRRLQTLTLRGRTVARLQSGERRRLMLPLVPRHGVCTLDLRVSPVVSPHRVIGNGDVRLLGVRLVGFRFAG
jgi:hypothetical protein